MTNPPELHRACAENLRANAGRVPSFTAFVGLDGFVDEILHVVDKRENAETYSRLPTIARLAERLAAVAGRSGNLEIVPQLTKLGGNGPIMANALASFGIRVTYLGNLGYPNLHPVFAEFAKRAEVHSLAEPGTTEALEFEDGKIMVGKHTSLKEVNWENVKARYGQAPLTEKMNRSDLVAFVNWTMLPYMSQLWEALLAEVCPQLTAPRRWMFFDLADPEKRTHADILHALDLIGQFGKYFDVILGLNERECIEIAEVCGVKPSFKSPEELAGTAGLTARKLAVKTLVVHPTSCAIAVGEGASSLVCGPYCPNPKVTTGAGDHFNSGFCLGKLLGFEDSMCLLTGVATSGHYVRTGESPTVAQIAQMIQNGW